MCIALYFCDVPHKLFFSNLSQIFLFSKQWNQAEAIFSVQCMYNTKMLRKVSGKREGLELRPDRLSLLIPVKILCI